MKLDLILGVVVAITAVTRTMAAPQLVGGYGSAKAPTARIEEIFKSVQLSVMKELERLKATGSLTDCESGPQVVSYITQIVAGTNYIMKVKMCENNYIAVKIYEPLPYTGLPCQLVELKVIGENDPLTHDLFSPKVQVDEELE